MFEAHNYLVEKILMCYVMFKQAKSTESGSCMFRLKGRLIRGDVMLTPGGGTAGGHVACALDIPSASGS